VDDVWGEDNENTW